MGTWHATLTYLLGTEPDLATLRRSLAEHDGTVTFDGRRLSIDLDLRSVHIDSLQSAARLATYLARRALYDAALIVEAESGLTVRLDRSEDTVDPFARAEGA